MSQNSTAQIKIEKKTKSRFYQFILDLKKNEAFSFIAFWKFYEIQEEEMHHMYKYLVQNNLVMWNYSLYLKQVLRSVLNKHGILFYLSLNN